ncbi:MAG: hypothetical protein IPH10_08205 [bacterium]|nr:hypothetical protein [bacterium]
MKDDSLVLTIRGRKFTPAFSLNVGKYKIDTKGVQTEVDAGYEGKSKIVLIEAKDSRLANVIIRQMYYPYRQWKIETGKEVVPVFFEKSGDTGRIRIWQLEFTDDNDYNSIRVVRSGTYFIDQAHLNTKSSATSGSSNTF